MFKKPLLNPKYEFQIIPGEGVLLLSEFSTKVLYGQIYETIMPFLTGKVATDEIVQSINSVPLTHLYFILLQMEKAGYLLEAENQVYTHEDHYWLAQDLLPDKSLHKKFSVSVVTYGEINIEPLRQALKDSNIEISSCGMLDIVITDHYLRPELLLYNKQALETNRPWILIKPLGLEPWVGPIFVPGKTACYDCLHYFMQRNQQVERLAWRYNMDEPIITSKAEFIPYLNVIFNLLTAEISNFFHASLNPNLQEKIISFDGRTFETKSHYFTNRVTCRSCLSSDGPISNHLSSNLEKKTKIVSKDGGYRTMAAEETIKKYEHLISPITGVIPSLYPASDKVVHVYHAGRNSAFPVKTLHELKHTLRTNSSGKGITATQAKVGALCEALERFSGEFQGTETRIKGCYKSLKNAIHPNHCMLFSDGQYKDRDLWNTKGSHFTKVAEPFDVNAQIDWTPVWSLSQNTTKYLPTEYLYFNYYEKQNTNNPFYCLADSNGNASGNTYEEAILQGFLELVERDNVAIWWYNRIERPTVDLDSFKEPYFELIKEHYASIEREIWVLDITNDLKIPTFVAVSRKVNSTSDSIIMGLGCHFDATISVTRALTEMNQALTAVNTIEQNENSVIDPFLKEWLAVAQIKDLNYLSPSNCLRPKNKSDYHFLDLAHISEYLEVASNIVEAKNLELIILDQTRPEINLSVVKVICPGLRHFWTRFAPGRLYDVPVDLGWLKTPLTENELNPFPIFF